MNVLRTTALFSLNGVGSRTLTVHTCSQTIATHAFVTVEGEQL
jgi:hypothetical protein